MLRGANGLPDPARIRTFITGVAGGRPAGRARRRAVLRRHQRARSAGSGRSPATGPRRRGRPRRPTAAPAPLTVALDGRGSTDPDGGTLTYAWDLDGDGAYDDSSAAAPVRVYTAPTAVGLRVRDASGLEDFAQVRVLPGIPPGAAIAAPAAGTTWAVGDRIAFSGGGTSATGAALPASALTWELRLHHCPVAGCHVHPIQTWAGTASGTIDAPDHEYPSYLELRLTATEGGLTTTVSRRLDPRTVALTMATDPPGLQAFLGSASGPAPLRADVIVGSTLVARRRGDAGAGRPRVGVHGLAGAGRRPCATWSPATPRPPTRRTSPPRPARGRRRRRTPAARARRRPPPPALRSLKPARAAAPRRAALRARAARRRAVLRRRGRLGDGSGPRRDGRAHVRRVGAPRARRAPVPRARRRAPPRHRRRARRPPRPDALARGRAGRRRPAQRPLVARGAHLGRRRGAPLRQRRAGRPPGRPRAARPHRQAAARRRPRPGRVAARADRRRQGPARGRWAPRRSPRWPRARCARAPRRARPSPRSGRRGRAARRACRARRRGRRRARRSGRRRGPSRAGGR